MRAAEAHARVHVCCSLVRPHTRSVHTGTLHAVMVVAALMVLLSSASGLSSWGGSTSMLASSAPAQPCGAHWVGTKGEEGGALRLRGGKVGGVKARELWDKSLEELGSLENDLRSELMSLRVAQQVGGQPGRVNRIKMVRKSIARVLTVTTSKRRADAFREVAKDKRKPYDARHTKNMPKAMRQRRTKHQLSLRSARALRCLRERRWGAGERPMAKGIHFMFTDPKEDLQRAREEVADNTDYNQYGCYKARQKSAPHIPPHAEAAMAKRKAAWKEEKKRQETFKAKMKERLEATTDDKRPWGLAMKKKFQEQIMEMDFGDDGGGDSSSS